MADTTNVTSFKADLERLAERVGVAKKLVVQKVSLDLWANVTLRTPVRTGRARANWNMTEGAPSQELREFPGAKEPDSVPAPAVPEIGGITGEAPVYIVNNLPYIEALEHGHSQQAPVGMVRLAIQEEQAILRGDASVIGEE